MRSKICIRILSLSSFSQKQANKWYFGKHAGLDFSSGAAVPLTGGSIDTDEGCALFPLVPNPRDQRRELSNVPGVREYIRDHKIIPQQLRYNPITSNFTYKAP
jgi:hypothetical protein